LADELATATDTINYEITCDLGKRIPRRFIRDGRVIGCRDYFNEKWDF
jgi:alanine racemase